MIHKRKTGLERSVKYLLEGLDRFHQRAHLALNINIMFSAAKVLAGLCRGPESPELLLFVYAINAVFLRGCSFVAHISALFGKSHYIDNLSDHK